MKRLSVHHDPRLCLSCQGGVPGRSMGVFDCPPSEGYVHVDMPIALTDGWTVLLDGEDVTARCSAVRVLPESTVWHRGWCVLIPEGPARICERCRDELVAEIWYSDDLVLGRVTVADPWAEWRDLGEPVG